MSTTRDVVLRWAEQGLISQSRVQDALNATGAEPSSGDWRRFLDKIFLWAGMVSLLTGIAFFIAYNWSAFGRYGKFALIEGLIAGGLFAYTKLGCERASGKAALFAVALLIGVLLALFGQTYQTGADPWQLFAFWALLITPLAIAGRVVALWMVWVWLINLSLLLYVSTFGSLLHMVLRDDDLLVVSTLLISFELAAWEAVAHRRRITERWAPRVMALASGTLATIMWFMTVFDDFGSAGLVIYGGWVAAVYGAYRHRLRDAIILAMGALSVVVALAAVVLKLAIENIDDVGALMLLAMAAALLGLSAGAAWWLKSVIREETP